MADDTGQTNHDENNKDDSFSGINFSVPPEFSPPVTKTTYKSATEYNKAVQQWVWQWQMCANMMCFNMMFPMYAMSSMPGTTAGVVPPTTQSSTVTNTAQPPAQPRAAAPVAAQANRGQEFTIPPLWKRVIAEFIDFILLFLIKLGVTLLTVEYVGGIDIERYDIELLFSQNIDYDTAYQLTSELVAMEIMNRILICIFETLCLRRGVGGMVGGTTPGKRIMGIRVVSCEDIFSIDENRVRVSPAGDIGLWNALVRSVIKNFSLAFFFPVCFTVFFFQHNRAAYDVISTCVVVEVPNEEAR